MHTRTDLTSIDSAEVMKKKADSPEQVRLAGATPQDLASRYVGKTANEAQIKVMTHKLGFDDPLYVQYFKWMVQVIEGNYGQSLDYGEPVANVIGDRLSLGMIASSLIICGGYVLGALIKRDTASRDR